VESHLN